MILKMIEDIYKAEIIEIPAKDVKLTDRFVCVVPQSKRLYLSEFFRQSAIVQEAITRSLKEEEDENIDDNQVASDELVDTVRQRELEVRRVLLLKHLFWQEMDEEYPRKRSEAFAIRKGWKLVIITKEEYIKELVEEQGGTASSHFFFGYAFDTNGNPTLGQC